MAAQSYRVVPPREHRGPLGGSTIVVGGATQPGGSTRVAVHTIPAVSSGEFRRQHVSYAFLLLTLPVQLQVLQLMTQHATAARAKRYIICLSCHDAQMGKK